METRLNTHVDWMRFSTAKTIQTGPCFEVIMVVRSTR